MRRAVLRANNALPPITGCHDAEHADKRRTFRQLHEAGCFVIPNPWDIGSARYLQHLGFKALATTSLGYAYAAGYADGEVPRDLMLDHIAELVEARDRAGQRRFRGRLCRTNRKAWRKA